MNPTTMAFERDKIMSDQQKEQRFQDRLAMYGVKSREEYEARRESNMSRLRERDAEIERKGALSKEAFRRADEDERKGREYQRSVEGFRPINDLLVKAGDLAVKMGGAGLIGELYKKVAPPSSEFYQKGTLEQKLRGATDIITQPVQKAVEERVKKAVGL